MKERKNEIPFPWLLNFPDFSNPPSIRDLRVGVMKRLLLFWKEGPRPFMFAPFQIFQISGRLKNMTGLMPSKFTRHPRELDELKRWKGHFY